MFTGIVEEIGTLAKVRPGAKSASLTISCKRILEDISVGDSISTNGVCLTVTHFDKSSFSCDVMHESLRRTSFDGLSLGSPLNLERAMPIGGRFGGHLVSGHIDGVGTITAIRQDDTAVWFTVSAAKSILKYIIDKGSITIDGISLTIAKVTSEDFSVSCIPHTLAVTNLGSKKVGNLVNLECDLIGKYVEKLLRFQEEEGMDKKSRISRDFLAEHGF